MGGIEDAELLLREKEDREWAEHWAEQRRTQRRWDEFKPESFELMKGKIYEWAGGLNLAISRPDPTFHPAHESSFQAGDSDPIISQIPSEVHGVFWGENYEFLAKATVLGEVGSIALSAFRVLLKDMPRPTINDYITDPISLGRAVRRLRVMLPENQNTKQRRRHRRNRRR